MNVASTLLIILGSYAAYMIIIIVFVKAFFPFYTREQLSQKRKLKNAPSIDVPLT